MIRSKRSVPWFKKSRKEQWTWFIFPTSMPLSFRVFRVQEVSLLSHLTNVDDPSPFPVFFTLNIPHNVAYLNQPTGSLADRSIPPWLYSLNAIKLITIFFKGDITFLHCQQGTTEWMIFLARYNPHSSDLSWWVKWFKIPQSDVTGVKSCSFIFQWLCSMNLYLLEASDVSCNVKRMW